MGAVCVFSWLSAGNALRANEFVVIEEAARKIEERCFYPMTVPVILDGVLRGMPGATAAGSLGQLSEQEAWAAFRQAVSGLAARPGERLGVQGLIEEGLSAYCRTLDAWSRYHSIADTARIDQFRQGSGSGIGCNLREADGVVYLYPMPESSASLSGVRPGDMLASVDGRAVKGKPLELIASWIKGAPGTQTTLRISRQTGRSQLIEVRREELEIPSVIEEKDITGITLRIRNFDSNLASHIRRAVEAQGRVRGLTLDLRGCHGGSMLASVEAARLFVPKGKRLLTLIERGSDPAHYDGELDAPPLAGISLSLLQDSGTGSAAEILIAALIENLPRQAASSGEPSHGKGVVQDAIRLPSGGELRLTTGILFGPGGKSWNDTGLLPSATHQGRIYSDAAVDMANPVARPKVKVRLVE